MFVFFFFQKKPHSVSDIAVEWRRVRTATRREYTAKTVDRTRTTVVAAAPRVHAAYDISRRGSRDENVRAAVHDHNEPVSRPRAAAAAVTAYTIRRAPGLNGGAVGTGRPAFGRGVGESSAAGTRWYGPPPPPPPPPPTLHPPPVRYANDAIKRRTLELEHDVCARESPRPAGGRKRVKINSRKSAR